MLLPSSTKTFSGRMPRTNPYTVSPALISEKLVTSLPDCAALRRLGLFETVTFLDLYCLLRMTRSSKTPPTRIFFIVEMSFFSEPSVRWPMRSNAFTPLPMSSVANSSVLSTTVPFVMSPGFSALKAASLLVSTAAGSLQETSSWRSTGSTESTRTLTTCPLVKWRPASSMNASLISATGSQALTSP